MKKSIIQNPIKQILINNGFEHVKNNDYMLLSKDQKTKLILRIPDGKNGNGFILAVQFSDFGSFDGMFSNAVMKQFDFAYDLAYGESQEYSEKDIIEVTERVMRTYDCYISHGKNAIKEHLNEWTFGDFNEQIKSDIQLYFGLSTIDPYSKDYQVYNANQMKKNGGTIVLSIQEYLQHKEFYDSYEEYGAKIINDTNIESITISFAEERKWWQK